MIIGYSVNRENFELGEEIIDKRTNESRSLMQKYYCMVKYGTEYPEKETKRIHRYVHYRNQQNEKKYKQAVEKGYSGDEFLDKIVPEDVFYKYEYLFNGGFNSENENVDNQADNNWREVIDFTIEEMIDMPVMDDENSEQNIIQYSDTHCANLHSELFYVTQKDLELVDIDDLY